MRGGARGMSTAEGGGGGGRVRKKRSKNGDGEKGPSKKRRIAAASTAEDSKTRNDDDTEDYNTNRDDIDDDNGDCTGDGDDSIYYYSDDDANTTEIDDDANPVEPAEKRYIVLSQDAIYARQDAAIAEVAEVLSVPSGFAAVLLRHYKWRPLRVQEEWFSDDWRIRDAVGLPANGGVVLVPTAFSSWRLTCGICFESFPAGWTRSAACSTHFYCDECWRGYIAAAVEDGPRCLSLRCPDTACSAAVVKDLVDTVAGDEDKARYARFALWSFVDESGGRIKWCPGRGCERAVEFLGCAAAGDATDVFCDCTQGFCWSCGEEAHRPVSCATVREWLAKNASDSETANWVLTHTKHCPKCRRPIEKNQGCNHMRCSAPCNHSFCWICLTLSGKCECGRYRRDRATSTPEEKASNREDKRRRKQAKASLDRYLYHYERWAANHASLQVVFKDMAELQQKGLEKMAEKVRVPASDLEFLTKAYEQFADCRRVLRWAHAYGYYLDPKRDAAKRNLFDQLQSDANMSLERLHGCAELERKQLCTGDGDGDAAERYKNYKNKLQSLTHVTRHYFENLVKAFETNLAEVESAKK